MIDKLIPATIVVSLLMCACASRNLELISQVRHGTIVYKGAKLKEKKSKRLETERQKALQKRAQEDFMSKKLLQIEPLGVAARPISEEAALKASKIRYQRTGLAEPLITSEQKIIYPYGLSTPKLLCAPLRISSIELEVGERILHVEAGDAKRWYINPNLFVGYSGSQRSIISIKPLGLQPMDTNLVITTNRRFYEIELKTVSRGEVGRHIGFYYPQSPDLIQPKSQNWLKNFASPEADSALVSVKNINFDYIIKGKKRLRWYPKRVFDDGRKTYIEFDPSLEVSELPIFMVLGKGGRVELVNKRFQQGRYIIDRQFDKGALVLGTGNRKQTIIIKRKTKTAYLGIGKIRD